MKLSLNVLARLAALVLTIPAPGGARAAEAQSPGSNPPVELPPAQDLAEFDSGGFRSLALPSVEWTMHKTADGLHPNAIEQEILWLMNRARADPVAEGAFLAGIQQTDVTSQYIGWGVDLEKMQMEFAEMAPRAPAAFDRRLYEGSLAHSNYLISVDEQSHDGQMERIVDAGFELTGARLSVFWKTRNPIHAHAAFNVDWGGADDGDGMQEGRGHRLGLMGYFEFPIVTRGQQLPNVGIAIVEESDPGTDVGPYVTSIAYALADASSSNHFNKFIVGTVWEDSNQNGRYNSGEGKNGVTVMPDSGTYFAVTGAAGGFAIPVSSDGEYTLSFSGGDLQTPEQRVVTIAGRSALALWRQEDAYLEDWTQPQFDIVFDFDGLLVAWDGEAEYEYQLQSSALEPIAFANDSRSVSKTGIRYSFRVPLQEMAEGRLFRLRLAR